MYSMPRSMFFIERVASAMAASTFAHDRGADNGAECMTGGRGDQQKWVSDWLAIKMK